MNKIVWILLIGITVLMSSFTAVLAVEKSEMVAAKVLQTESIDVAPIEDLMREHGVLSRLLLIYEEIIRRLDNNEKYPPEALYQSTMLIRNFIQNYHEKLEEQYLFPRFQKANMLIELTTTLKQQHVSGHNIIDSIMVYEKMQKAGDKQKLIASMHAFLRLYRPHKAREDTILFPAVHKIVSKQEYEKLGDIFEDKEQQLFGKNGFENIVQQVEAIEKSLNIYNLSQFTMAVR